MQHLQETETRTRRGLSEREVAQARRQYGENRLACQKRRSFGRRFLANMGDPVIKILLCALALNVLFMIRSANWYETIGIAVSVFLATFISTLSEYGSEAAFAKLSEESEQMTCRVRRDGIVREIPVTEVVVGDILLLGAGEKIPADGRMLTGRIGVDQSAMTGEGREIEKTPGGTRASLPDPSEPWAVLGGCVVTSGEGEAEVCRVGEATFLGEISREIQQETRQSPLKVRLTKLAETISRLGYMAAILVALAYLVNTFVLDSGFHPALIRLKVSSAPYVFSELLQALTLGLTVIVVAVPEGLPMMIAVVLSSNMKRMVKDRVLVRKPVGLEAAGSMNLLFTDKTGTLTEGKLTVVSYVLGDGTVLPAQDTASRAAPIRRYLALSGLYNTASDIGFHADGTISAIGGNMTDMALAEAVIGSDLPRAIRVTQKQPFDSVRKYSAVALACPEPMVLVKGAAERLLPHATGCLREDGSRGALNAVRLEKRLKALAEEGNRIVLLARSDRMPTADGRPGDLTLIGAAVLRDRVRREAARSVAALRGAGIHVVMVTGDSAETAAAIARESGILGDGTDLCLTSANLARMSDMRLREWLPRIGVIARALPGDKSRLVRVAQEADLVVGMTGDGINDAPALKRADIGFAMGSGTQVAKEAGDIIILDNNLASIVKAVLYGRNIFKSIRKFIALQLTMNLCAVGVSMIGPFIGFDAPVTVVQMLWINMIMDTLGGLAFAGEPALPSCMREAPKRRDEAILNRYMIGEILYLGLYTVGLCLTFLTCPAITRCFRYDPDHLYLLTAFFALFIFASVFNCFGTRTDSLNPLRGLGRNRAFLTIMAAIAVIQIGFVYLGGHVLRTAPLTWPELRMTLLLALTVLPAEWLRKLILRLIGSPHRSY